MKLVSTKLVVVLAGIAVIGCEEAPTELSTDPGAPTTSEGEQELASQDGALDLAEMISFYEEVAADPEARERFAFGGSDGPMTAEEALDLLSAARPAPSRQREVKASQYACSLRGQSGIGSHGAPPQSRTIEAFASSVVMDFSYNRPCYSHSGYTAVQASVELRDMNNGYQVWATALGLTCPSQHYCGGNRFHAWTGPALRGFVDATHFASGFPDEHTGAVATGI